MCCDELIQEISSYLDGETTAELRLHIEEHLQRCGDCRIVVDTTRKTIELYCDGRLYPLPERVRVRVHEALRRRCREAAR